METAVKKDFWDILKIVGFVAIPIVIAIVGYFANSSLKKKDIEVRMIELAVGILKEDPNAKDNQETPPMRKWAIEVINKYSSVKFSDELKNELEKKPFPETVGTMTGTAIWKTYWDAADEIFKKDNRKQAGSHLD